MMGHCRAAHVHHGGDIDDAFLAVAQDPEDAEPAAVSQEPEDVRRYLKIIGFRNGIHTLFQRSPMVMG